MKNVSLLLVILLLGVAANAQVMSGFTSKTRVCSGEPFALTSAAINANAYHWLINGSSYATSPDTAMIINTACSTEYTVSLVAMNTIEGTTDTFTRHISAMSNSCAGEFGVEYMGCWGDTITFYGPSDGVSYNWHFSEPQELISGCETCNNVKYSLTTNYLQVHNLVIYDGGCNDMYTYSHTYCPGGWLAVENVKDGDGISIAPNPVTDKATLRFPNAEGKKYTFQLYTIDGRIVRQIENITSGELVLYREGLSAGSYFYHLSGPDTRTVKGRIFIN